MVIFKILGGGGGGGGGGGSFPPSPVDRALLGGLLLTVGLWDIFLYLVYAC